MGEQQRSNPESQDPEPRARDPPPHILDYYHERAYGCSLSDFIKIAYPRPDKAAEGNPEWIFELESSVVYARGYVRGDRDEAVERFNLEASIRRYKGVCEVRECHAWDHDEGAMLHVIRGLGVEPIGWWDENVPCSPEDRRE